MATSVANVRQLVSQLSSYTGTHKDQVEKYWIVFDLLQFIILNTVIASFNFFVGIDRCWRVFCNSRHRILQKLWKYLSKLVSHCITPFSFIVSQLMSFFCSNNQLINLVYWVFLKCAILKPLKMCWVKLIRNLKMWIFDYFKSRLFRLSHRFSDLKLSDKHIFRKMFVNWKPKSYFYIDFKNWKSSF